MDASPPFPVSPSSSPPHTAFAPAARTETLPVPGTGVRCPICAAHLPSPARPDETPVCLSCHFLLGIEDGPDGGTAALDKELHPGEGSSNAGRNGGVIGEHFGGYEILGELGRGGMGVIYRARQLAGDSAGRIVALKTMRHAQAADESGDSLERFRREAEAAASLDHPNILPIYEVGEVDGQPFFSMQLAEGGSLATARPQFAGQPREAVALVAKITRAIAHAHERGVLHRDLKPANILLDSNGEPLVADFGLAKWLDRQSDLTQSLIIFGTPGYLAPEQAAGHANHATPAADIYSLGAILYELLCGRPPFIGANAWDVLQQAAHHPAAPLRKRNPHAPRDLEVICERCLETETPARYQTATALAEDLERWLQRRSIQARPVSPPAKAWRWARRNPVVASVALVCTLLGALFTGRQIENTYLKGTLREGQLYQHSLTVMPFLDMDDGCTNGRVANLVAAALDKEVQRMGVGEVRALDPASLKWSGVGRPDELKQAAHQTGRPNVLTGTYRRFDGQLRLSLHLLDGSSGEALGRWVVEVKALEVIEATLHTRKLGGVLYPRLGKHGNTSKETLETDPALRNETARGFVISGRDLMSRQNITDINRAVTCLETALQLEPRSVVARAYLAQACLAHHWLRPNPAYAERAFRYAQEASKLAPEDAGANRVLCVFYTANGQLEQALEHGLCSVESGESHERAFGQIGYLWKILGRPDKAISWYRMAKANEQQPANNYDALIGDCFADLGDDESARQAYELSARQRPEQPDGWMGLCHLKLLAGDFDTARMLYQEHAAEYETYITALEFGAQIEFLARDYAQARRLYTEIHKRAPGYVPSTFGAMDHRTALAQLELKAGNPAAARTLVSEVISECETQLAKAPRSPETLCRLAAAHAVAGNTRAALNYLQAATGAGWIGYRWLQLDPQFDSVAKEAAFQNILSTLAARVAELRRQQPAAESVENHKKER